MGQACDRRYSDKVSKFRIFGRFPALFDSYRQRLLITHSDADLCEQFDICTNSCLSDRDVIILSEDSASVSCPDSEHESLDMESAMMNSDDDPLLESKASKRKC